MTASTRAYRAGESLEDFCRVCKTDRLHTVIAADTAGRPIRVSCGYCHSEHNYRGGARIGVDVDATARSARPTDTVVTESRRSSVSAPFPIVSDRKRTPPPMSVERERDLELLLRRIIREEAGITPVTPAEKWRGGTLILKPGTPGLQDKSW